MGFNFNGATFKGEVEILPGATVPTVPSSNVTTLIQTNSTSDTLTVPAGKKWLILSVMLYSINTASINFTINGTTVLSEATTDGYKFLSGNPILILDEAETMSLGGSGGTAIVTYLEV